MSHSTFVKDDDGREWVFIHNGDWSGDVIIRPVGDDKAADVVLPGAIIRKACAGAVAGDLTALIEQWDGSSEAIERAQAALTGRR